jgi:hypothetical protein
MTQPEPEPEACATDRRLRVVSDGPGVGRRGRRHGELMTCQ